MEDIRMPRFMVPSAGGHTLASVMPPFITPRERLKEVIRKRQIPKQAGQILSGFRAFVLRGNVVDLAVGIIIGASFNSLVNAFVHDLIAPLVGTIGPGPDFSSLQFTVRGSVFRVGDVLDALISFVIQAAIIYFAIVLPANAFVRRERRAPIPSDPTTKKCPECLSEIPIPARRCKFCTQIQPDILPREGE